ncbi:MAG: hypothetical protein ACLFUB_10570 [Cyclobacteriaceae bacterium]
MKTYLILFGLCAVLTTLASIGIFVSTPEKPSYQQQLINAGFQGKYQPVKTLFDENKGRLFWLNMLGEIHSIGRDMQNHRLISTTGEGWKDVTFIEDFCLSEHYDSLYFTDIMDLQTGMSALKVTDTAGTAVKALKFFRQEIPYAVRMLNESRLLFLLSDAKVAGRSQFRLRFLDLKDGNAGVLYISDHRIEQLEIKAAEKTIVAHDSQQQLISFSTEVDQFINTIFEQ